jgi:threonyl-tRNA synthetase
LRIILLHSDEFEYEPKKRAIKAAEEIEHVAVKVEEPLVAMMAVESSDESTIKETVTRSVEEISKVADELKTENIVCYPWVHLTSTPSRPDIALKIMRQVESELKASGKYKKVVRAPFGWYKGFTVKVKGHPLSELSREFVISTDGAVQDERLEIESKAIAAEEEAKHEFFIVNDGELVPFKEYKFDPKSDFKTFFDYETQKRRASDKPPAHVDLMKRLEIADYEPATDAGNMRWYPVGWTMKKLIEDYVTDTMVENGAYCVETPIMYNFKHPALESYMNRFPARQYTIHSGSDDYFLRFAACFGQFLIASDAVISHHNLPLKLFEMTHYSFRREQRGELAALRRLRTFSMPDQHTIVKDLEMAKNEFREQYELCVKMMDDFELNYEAVFRFQEDFYKENEQWIKEMIAVINRPVMLELFDKRYAYFVCKFEFNFVDGQKKAAALSTVQIDVENAERFDVNFIGADGEKKTPYILHASMSGAVERVIYGILEQAAKKIRIGEKPSFPFWLAPVQVRLLPLSKDQLEYANEFANELEQNGIRVDIDDRGERVTRMIRDGERLWIPYLIVLGDKEVQSNKFTPRLRSGEEVSYTKAKLIKHLKSLNQDFPSRKLPLSRFLSKRPIFYSSN